MKFLQLEYFETVCMYKSINKASEKLHVSQPAITKSIQQLELEFDIALFHRTGNRLSLTEEGEFFLRYAKDINKRVKLLEERMHEKSRNMHSIKLGVPPMIGAFMFPQLFNHFMASHSNISIEIFEQGSSQMTQLIDDNTLDMAIVILNNISPSHYNVIHIYDTELVYCTNPVSPLCLLDMVSISDIQTVPLILMREGSYQNPIIKSRFSDQQVSPNIIFYSNQLHTIKSFIRNNFASAFLIKEVVDKHEDIVAIPMSDPLPIKIGLIWKKNNHLPNHFIKFIKSIQLYEYP
mgnify:CR=1 FL=1